MTIKYYLISISLCVLCLTNAKPQSNLPDSLFKQGNYRLAALEYERLVSFGATASKINEWRYQRARCFKQLGDYKRSQVELSKIVYWNLPDSLSLIYKIETALCDYLSGSFTSCLHQLDQINDTLIENQDDKRTVVLLKALCHNELMDWQKAHQWAVRYVQLTYNTVQVDSLNKLLANCYKKRNLPNIKSEKKANVLRMLPGLGQAYAGKPAEGLLNFSINLAFLSIGAYQVYKTFYITGYFVGAIGINKVYFGGHARTEYLLGKYNYKQRKDFCEKVKQIITNEKAGF